MANAQVPVTPISSYDANFVAGDRRAQFGALAVNAGSTKYKQITRSGDGAYVTDGGIKITPDDVQLTQIDHLHVVENFDADAIANRPVLAGRASDGSWVVALVDKSTGAEADAGDDFPVAFGFFALGH